MNTTMITTAGSTSDTTIEMGPITSSNTFFGFSDLAPELRNRIYSAYFEGDALDLANFKLPAVTRASRQLRSESLPIFFAEKEFYVNIMTELSDHHRSKPHNWFENLRSKQPRGPEKSIPTGSLRIKRAVVRFVQNAGDNAIFRSITLRARRPVRASNGRLAGSTTVATLALSLGSVHQTLEVSEKNRLRPSHAKSRAIDVRTDDDVLRTALNLAQQRAREIADREGFKGFTLQDIRHVAKAFAAA